MVATNWIPDIKNPPAYGKPSAMILIRLFAGFCMFLAGFEKVVSKPAFSAAGYLKYVAGGGYFHNWYVGLAGSSTIGIVNALVVVGEVCVGLALILGLLTRFACYMGTIETGLIWITEYREIAVSAGPTGLAVSAPVTGPFNLGWSTGPLEICAALIAMFIVSALIGGGLIYGIDAWIEKRAFIQKHKWLKVFLG